MPEEGLLGSGAAEKGFHQQMGPACVAEVVECLLIGNFVCFWLVLGRERVGICWLGEVLQQEM